MRIKIIALLVSVALLIAGSTGCRKSKTASVAEQPPGGPEQTNVSGAAGQPEPPPPPPSQAVVARAENAVKQSVVGEVDAFLTGELRKFIEQKQRLPATFAEFATLRLDSVPRPPEGKKWAIDTESLEVKAVPAQ